MDWSPLWLSLRVAAVSTIVSCPLALSLAWALHNRQFRFKKLAEAVIALPVVLPSTVFAYYLLVLFGGNSIFGKAWKWTFGTPLLFTVKAAIFAAILHSAPFLVRASRQAFEQVDQNCERAARTMGASEWRLFWRITFPLSQRALSAATLLAFARALGDFGITLLIAGQTRTAAIAVFQAVQSGDMATARGLALAVTVLVIALIFAAHRTEPERAR